MAAEGVPRDLIAQILAVAQDAARRAGRLMREGLGAQVLKTKANSADLLTEYDLKCQAAIKACIAAAFPTHDFLGEEEVEPGHAAAKAAAAACQEKEWVWVVDPIDGTSMFAQGMPMSTVSIACAHRGAVTVAVILDPYRDELFAACRGQGATLNGRPIHVSTVSRLQEAVLACNMGHSPRKREPACRAMVELTSQVRALRNMGSACLHLAYVACGRMTGFWQLELGPWDIAAGSLIITEAGGMVTSTTGEPYALSELSIVASNGGAVHASLLEVLDRTDAARPWGEEAVERAVAARTAAVAAHDVARRAAAAAGGAGEAAAAAAAAAAAK